MTSLPAAFGLGSGVFGLGLVMGFSPPLYALSAVALTRSPRPRRSATWIAAGLGAGAVVLLSVFAFVNPERTVAVIRGDIYGLLLSRVVDVALGSALIIAALVVGLHARHRPRIPRESHDHDLSRRGLFTAGLINGLWGFSPVLTSYLVDRLLSDATDEVLLRGLGYAIFLFGATGPYLAAGLLWARIPALTSAITTAYGWLRRRDWRPPIAWGLLAVGVVFLAEGAWALAVPHR